MEQTEYTLTADEQGMIKPLLETAENLQKETQVILRAVCRLRNLEGQWNLFGDKMVKASTNGNGATLEVKE